MSNQVPDGWFLSTIKDTANKKDKYSFTGGPFGSDLKSEDYTLKGVRILQLQNIGDGFFKDSYKIYTSKAKADALHSCNIYPGDIILSKMGDPVARAVIVPDFSERYVMASDGIRLAVDCARFSTKFVHDMINAHSFRSQAELNSSGTTRKRIGLTQLRELTFACPPLPEQQKIAAILTSVDDVIEKTQAQINKLKDLKIGMMQELLTRGVGVDGKPHTEFKDSPVGRIPKAWDCCLLDKVAKRGSGHTPDKQKSEYWNDGIKWVSLTDSSKLDKLHLYKTSKEISQLGIDNSSATLHPSGTVVMARDAGIGKSAIIQSPMAVSQHFMAWVCSDKLDNYFLYYLLQYWKPIFENIAMGSTIKTIGLPFFKKLQIPLPSIDEQKIIAKSLKAVESNIFKLEEKNTKNQAMKKALMQDLLTGKVRVNVD
ncbi:restriction endonuclease subunit S [Photobacterium piscicola]|uniref:Restriction endonuclease subunit S n=1 Tax=Photobacterium piscicola TaxID=1378299 RepID=A0ABU6LHX5_9GAMM|nr:restriction endonuclease subunit S [Photobacterium piscicola]